MPYRKVGYLEQCWYILRYKAKETREKIRECLGNQSAPAATPDARGSQKNGTAKSTKE